MGDDTPEFKPEKCMGCGVCTDVCSQGCLSMTRDDPAVCEPLDVDVLIPLYTPKP
jgi:ferredoxin